MQVVTSDINSTRYINTLFERKLHKGQETPQPNNYTCLHLQSYPICSIKLLIVSKISYFAAIPPSQFENQSTSVTNDNMSPISTFISQDASSLRGAPSVRDHTNGLTSINPSSAMSLRVADNSRVAETRFSSRRSFCGA